MNIVLFGGTGPTGWHVMHQAIDEGHAVTLVARSPDKVSVRHPRLTVVRGDVLDRASLLTPVANKDAVISVVGASSLRQMQRPDGIYSEGTRNIFDAMREGSVRRFIGVTSAALEDTGDEPWLFRNVLRPMLRRVYDDMRQMEELVRESDRDWTLVRPPRLTDGPRTGSYRVQIDGAIPGGHELSRADTADFLLRALDPTYVRTTVTVAY